MSGQVSLGPFAAASSIEAATDFPELYRVRQLFEDDGVRDLGAAVRETLEPVAKRVTPGMRIALTGGSRGIANIAEILRETGRTLRSFGAEPFLVPSMGSHGGGTFVGQVDMLEHLGITESSVEMPIRGDDESVHLGVIEDGPEIYLDKTAYEADAILVVNRVKPHTDFHGDAESGLAKMLAIGLGKRRGAVSIHASGPNGLIEHIAPVAQRIVATGKVLGGLAIIENSLHDTKHVAFVEPEGIGGPAETELLKEADAALGRLPFDGLEVLVVGEVGKDKSGTGMDPNVIGRFRIEGLEDPVRPEIAVIVALNLSKGSNGNGLGIGLADLTTLKAVAALDLYVTYVNTLTSGLGGIQRGSIPLALRSDREAIGAALAICGERNPERRRLVYIDDTLSLGEIVISASLLGEAVAHPRLEVLGSIGPMRFDADGNLQIRD